MRMQNMHLGMQEGSHNSTWTFKAPNHPPTLRTILLDFSVSTQSTFNYQTHHCEAQDTVQSSLYAFLFAEIALLFIYTLSAQYSTYGRHWKECLLNK